MSPNITCHFERNNSRPVIFTHFYAMSLTYSDALLIGRTMFLWKIS